MLPARYTAPSLVGATRNVKSKLHLLRFVVDLSYDTSYNKSANAKMLHSCLCDLLHNKSKEWIVRMNHGVCIGCRRVLFYQLETSWLAEHQMHCETLQHPDDHTDIVRYFYLTLF